VTGPVSLVTVHHRGAGTPSDVVVDIGGYTYWIGVSRFSHLRTVWRSTATRGFNGRSLDVCLSGNRMLQGVTANDIALIRNAVADARGRRYVTNNPMVRAHRNSPGSATVCPGSHTMNVWNQIVAACQAGTVPPTPPPAPPPPPEVLLTTVASPRVTNGRRGTARPVPAIGAVLLENGASLRGDQPSGRNRVFVNPDPLVRSRNARLIDITPTVGNDGRPDGRGIEELRDLGNNEVGTYTILWS
jgi:hypothetical protein